MKRNTSADTPYVDAQMAKLPDHYGYGDTTQASEEAPRTAQHLEPVRAGHTRAAGEEPPRPADVRSGHQAAARGDVVLFATNVLGELEPWQRVVLNVSGVRFVAAAPASFNRRRLVAMVAADALHWHVAARRRARLSRMRSGYRRRRR